jgi:hypothetical protein
MNENYLEGSGHVLIQIPSLYLPGGIEKNHEILQRE